MERVTRVTDTGLDEETRERSVLDGKLRELWDRHIHRQVDLPPLARDWLSNWFVGLHHLQGANLDQARQLVAQYASPAGTEPAAESNGNGNGKPKAKARRSKPAPAATDRKATGTPAGIVGDAPVEFLPLDQIEVLPGNPVPDPEVVSQIQAHGQDEPAIVLAPGVLVCPANIGVRIGPLKYVLIAGASRLEAARRSGWPSLQVRIRREPITLEEAIAFALRSNTGRRVVSTAEKAARVRQLADCGLNDSQIAERLEINRTEACQLRRFGELPKVWQERVARHDRDEDGDDKISWAAAKKLLPYADMPSVLQALERDWENEWHRTDLQDRNRLAEEVASVCDSETWPVVPGQKWYDCEIHCERVIPKTAVPEADWARLQVQEVTVRNGKREQRATCLRAVYDEVFPPPKKQSRATSQDAGEDRPAKPAAPKLTPKQQAAKDKADDQALAERLTRNGGLVELGLRIACATDPNLKPGSAAARNVYRWLSACARDSQGAAQLDPSQWICDAAIVWAKGHGVTLPKLKPRAGYLGPTKEECGRFLATLATVDDPITAHDEIEVEACRLVLWPQTDATKGSGLFEPNEWPERLPWIDSWLLKAIAAELDVTIADAWELGRPGPGRRWPAAKQWFVKFVEAYDKRQRTDLAGEVVKSFATAAASLGFPRDLDEFAKLKSQQQVDVLVLCHERDGLRLPKICQTAVKAKKGA